MEIYKELEELKKQLEVEAETEVEEKEEELTEEPTLDPVVDEPEQQEEAPEKTEEPITETKEERPDNAAMARLRRERAAEKKRADELQAALEAARAASTPAAPAQAPQVDVEPDKATAYAAWLEWRVRQQDKSLQEMRQMFEPVVEATRVKETLDATIRSLDTLETQFKSSAPDYDGVMEGYKESMKAGLEALYPFATPEQIAAEMGRQIIATSQSIASQGLNPIEELYHIAKERGYGQRQQVSEAQVARKPDLSKVAANRSRNAGMAAASGGSKAAQMTMETAAEMTPEQWSRLTPQEKRAIMPGLTVD